MDPKDKVNSQPIRELEWLASFFINHGRSDLAKRIVEEIRSLQTRVRTGNSNNFHLDEPNSQTNQNSSNNSNY